MSKYENIQKLVLVSILSFLTGCGATGSSRNESSSAANTSAMPRDQNTGGKNIGGGGGGKEAPAVVQQISLVKAEQTQNEPAATERKIIRNADLQLEADAPPEVQQKIAQIVESKGGFVIESTQSSSNTATTRDAVTMTVRVPAAKFEESLGEIRQTASRVIVETVKGEDVTEEFIDIEARLKSQKALEAQFLEIMKQAKSVEDALDVQRQLADVRGEIEKVEGRKKFLENQASLSTIKIRLQTPAVFSANSEGFFYRLRQSVSGGFDFAVSFILALVSFVIGALPFVLLIVLPLLLVIRYLWRKWRRRKTANEIAREEIKNE